jgi:hypothetical protein
MSTEEDIASEEDVTSDSIQLPEVKTLDTTPNKLKNKSENEQIITSKNKVVADQTNRSKTKKPKELGVEETYMTLDECYKESISNVLGLSDSEESNMNLDVLDELSDNSSEGSSSGASSLKSYGYDQEINKIGEELELKGSASVKPKSKGVRVIDTDTVVVDEDEILIVQSKLPIKITLKEQKVVNPSELPLIYLGKELIIKNKNHNVDVNIIPTRNTINDLNHYTLRGKERIDIIFNGKTWITY